MRQTSNTPSNLAVVLPLALGAIAAAIPVAGSLPQANATQSPATAARDTTVLEAETMTLPPRTGQTVSDSSASAGRALMISGTARAAKTVTLGSANAVVVRARAQRCKGAPRMSVLVDGREVLTTAVSARSWTDYRAAAEVAPGQHTVQVAFTNDFRRRRCDRNLLVDAVRFTAGSSPTPPPSTPTLAPSDTPRPEPTPSESTPPSASGKVVFNGGFDNNFGDWTEVQEVSDDRVRAEPDPAGGGKGTVGRFEIRGGDRLLYGGQRAEVLWGSDSHLTLNEGDDYYFGWSTLFPNDFPSPTDGGHCIFVQWHQDGGDSPPIDLECRNNRIQISYQGQGGWSIPLVRGGWNDFVAHVKFSESSSKGLIELWHKAPGESQLTKKVSLNTETLLPGRRGSYLKVGYYRRDDERRTGVIYHAATRVGTSFDAVAPR